MIETRIVDNFLPESIFNELVRAIVWNEQVTWNLVNKVTNLETKEEESELDNFHIGHIIYNVGVPQSPIYEPIVDMVLRNISPPGTGDMKALLRMKLNFYPHTDELYQHKMHIDYPYEHTGALLSLNTCDGGTVLEDGIKYDSVANRMLFFDASKLHASTTTTNQKGRFNLLINYL